jgi:hypothetical protein
MLCKSRCYARAASTALASGECRDAAALETSGAASGEPIDFTGYPFLIADQRVV